MFVKPVNETSKTPKVLNSHFIIAEVHSLEASHCSQLVQQMLCCYKAVLQDVNITVQDQAVSMWITNEIPQALTTKFLFSKYLYLFSPNLLL